MSSPYNNELLAKRCDDISAQAREIANELPNDDSWNVALNDFSSRADIIADHFREVRT